MSPFYPRGFDFHPLNVRSFADDAASKDAVRPAADLTGADDPMAPAEQVAKFEQEMKDAGVDYRVVTYPGAKHSFTNPAADKYGKQFNMPLAYNAEADQASWDELDKFLQQIFSATDAGSGKSKAVGN